MHGGWLIKRNTIRNHVRSQKCECSKKKQEMKDKRELDIGNALVKHNGEVHLHGDFQCDNRCIELSTYVVTSLFWAEIPLSKFDSLRDILEENAYRPTDCLRTLYFEGGSPHLNGIYWQIPFHHFCWNFSIGEGIAYHCSFCWRRADLRTLFDSNAAVVQVHDWPRG